MLTMLRPSKITAPPPVPPRPSKSIVAEALAKSRKVSPVRALYATQPLSAGDLCQKNVAAPQEGATPPVMRPVVPVRVAPPPPVLKPKPLASYGAPLAFNGPPLKGNGPPLKGNGSPLKGNGQIAQPQVVKSYSSAMVFNPKLRQPEESRVIRSVSDVSDEITCGKSRTIVYQSSNLKTSKIEVRLGRKPSVKERVDSTNERNRLNGVEGGGIWSNTSRGPGVTLIDEKMQKGSERDLPEKGEPKTPTPGVLEKQTQEIPEKGAPEIPEKGAPETPEKGTSKLLEKGEPEILAKGASKLPEIRTPQIQTPEKQILIPEKQIQIPEKQIQIPELDSIEMNQIDKVIDVIINDKKISETIVQSSDKTTIIVNTKPDDDNNNSFEPPNPDPNPDKKVQFDDKLNHEILIAELQSMKEEQERFLKRQRKVPEEIFDCDSESVHSSSDATRIQRSDWIEVANNGEEVRLSSCQIYIDNSDESSKSSSFSSSSSRKPQRAPSMSSLHGLPPLPKSLSGFNFSDNTSGHRVETPRGSYRVPASPGPQTPSRAGSSRGATPPTPGSGSGHVVYPPHPRVNGTGEIPRGRKITTLDTQLAVLRREMYGLRQLDLSLLSQLYSLNEAIQDFRQMLQDQEDSALSPNSPSPSPSSGDEGDEFYSPAPLRYKPAPPAPPLRRTSNSSSANSSEYGTV